MNLSQTTLAAMFLGLNTTFMRVLQSSPTVYNQLAMTVQSTGRGNVYPMLSDIPAMREWIGDKRVDQMDGKDYTIVNKSYESTIAVKRDDIEDDNLGFYTMQAGAIGEAGATLWDELLAEVINNGFTNLTYDGQAFFSDSHELKSPDFSGTFSNKGTKKLSAATQAAAKASLGAALESFGSLKRANGKPLGVRPNVLMVPPALEDVANALMTADRLEDGKVNLHKGRLTVVINPFLTSPDAWFVLATDRSMRPFIVQKRKEPVMVSQTDMNADDVFMRAEYKFGVEARGAAGYGPWQLAYGSNGTVA